MIHLDLFSGIGGFSYAADQVWNNVEHIFVEFDPFCQQVLKKHWPEAPIHGDIKTFTADTYSAGRKGSNLLQQRRPSSGWSDKEWPFILTGGFPCQPFSAAGLRRGTADDRHLWPEMLRIIRLTKPQWVIAENVRGIANWNDGLVFEQVCADLEASGYEVQPFIIPAVSVNAPHRRDRVWFIANYTGERLQGELHKSGKNGSRPPKTSQPGSGIKNNDATNTSSIGQQPGRVKDGPHQTGQRSQRQQENKRHDIPDWGRDWTKVATEFCSVDDGLPVELDGFKLTKSAHRREQLKAYGNAIVPQVAIEIMRAMQ